MTSTAADSVAPPGYSGPIIEPIRRTAPEPEIVVQQEQALAQQRRMPSDSAVPWRGLAVAAAVAAAAAVVYFAFLGPKSEADRARQTISDYEHAVVADDGARACSLLTSEARMQVIARGLRAGIHGGCPAVLGVVGGRVGSLVSQAKAAGKGGEVDAALSAAGAKVAVDPTRTYAAAIPYGRPIMLVRANGHWLIDSITGRHADPKPAHVTGANHAFATKVNALCLAQEHTAGPLAKVAGTELVQAAAGQATPALATHLQTLSASNDKLIYRLSRLAPPAAEASAYAAFLAGQENEIPIVHKAVGFAQQGQPADAFLQMALGAEADRGYQQVGASLGIHAC